MTTPQPTPEQAAVALQQAEKSSAGLAKRVIAVRVAMAGLAAGSLASLLILGLVPGKGAAIGSTAMMLGAVVALLTIVAPLQGKVREKNFIRRYITAILSWGAIFAATVIIGGFFFQNTPAFWIVGAIASALPGAWYAFAPSGAKR